MDESQLARVRQFNRTLTRRIGALSDDYLGSATTDADGRYEVRFAAESFRDLFERHPDLFVRVYDATGREVASTQDAVRWNAGAVERVDLAVPSARLV